MSQATGELAEHWTANSYDQQDMKKWLGREASEIILGEIATNILPNVYDFEPVTPEEFENRVRMRAEEIYHQHGIEGRCVENWLQAEHQLRMEIDNKDTRLRNTLDLMLKRFAAESAVDYDEIRNMLKTAITGSTKGDKDLAQCMTELGKVETYHRLNFSINIAMYIHNR